jgi:hypothetical protein
VEFDVGHGENGTLMAHWEFGRMPVWRQFSLFLPGEEEIPLDCPLGSVNP